MSVTSDIRTLGPRRAIKSVKKAMKTNRPVMLWGPPGIGKSDIVHQIGAEQDRNVIDIRLPLWEPTDIKGIPYYNTDSNSMCWAPPVELPSDADDNSILFLDELASAPPAVQAAAYQLILNRRVGTYRLPDGVSIVAAGNRESDKGVTYRMPAPLANRFSHVEVSVEFDSWLEWAGKNKIHKDVVGYISFAKQDLYDFDPRSASRSFATPRSWAFVSQYLYDDDGDDETLGDLIAGTVGEGLAIKFMAHRKHSSKLPKAEDILAGTVTKLEGIEVSAQYSLTVSLCYELQEYFDKSGKKPEEKKWHSMVDNFLEFMMNNFSTELVIMGIKMAMTNHGLVFQPSKLKSFEKFHAKYGKYIKQAAQ
jgi:hypothetical protein